MFILLFEMIIWVDLFNIYDWDDETIKIDIQKD